MSCPNCRGRGCLECLKYGPFGLVPDIDGIDVEIALRVGPSVDPVELVRRRAFTEWLTSDGGCEEYVTRQTAAMADREERVKMRDAEAVFADAVEESDADD